MSKRRINELSIIDVPTQSEIEKKQLKNILIIIVLSIFTVIALSVSLFTTNFVTKITDELPKTSIYNPDESTQIFDVNNQLIANIQGDEDRVIVPLEKISPYLQKAVISIEDNRFYEHKGIDFTGTIRAAFSNFSNTGKSLQGGSTLTQQLVKNSFLLPERSFKRKFIEAIYAIQIEKNFSKDKILEMYLNQVYWGNLAYGAERAAFKYFKKSASQLNLAESALLAGLLKAPEDYSPYTNLNKAKTRQKLVLQKMEYYGYITHNQRIKTEKEPLKLALPRQTYYKYPYFVSYVFYLLKKSYGEDVVRKGGLKVYTTLDPIAQKIADKTIRQGIKLMPKKSGVKQGALISINVYNGYIQALVGGVDYAKSNFNRATQSKRAAGSSFKPIIYLTGLRTGVITSESSVIDAPISFNTGWNIWRPTNWDGRYMGKMTVRKALSLSRNTPTVRIALKVGLDSIIKTARLLGIRSYINKNYSIALGSAGISPLEMTTVYSTLAREGIYTEPTAIRKVEDSQGNLLEIHNPAPIRVVSPNFVRELNSILIDVVEKGTGKLAKLNDRVVAGKTGTTDDVRDIWFTGFTPDTVTTIWMGNDQNTELKGVFSSNCAQLWGMFSKEYYKAKNIPPQYFIQPDK
ncbi:MAG: transglycosylase domain-containing protein [bacterium]